MPFSGWEVVEDSASHHAVQLRPSQKPQARGVYIMYHGTRVASARSIIANGFEQSTKGMLGRGVYVSRDKNKAALYPQHGTPADQVILELHVRVGRVKRIDKDNHPLQFNWHSHGYDTAWVPPNIGLLAAPKGLEEDCVFDPKRVKVVGIVQAPNLTIQKELEQQLAKRRDDAANLCPLCKRNTQQGAPHISQQCWKCGKNICILIAKHFCP